MKLFLDARWTRTDYHDGISRYTSGLLEGFKALNIPVTAIICDPKQLDLLPAEIDSVLLNHPVSVREPFIARKLNAMGADVVFSPLQVMGFWGRKYQLILTLQDIIYYQYPKPPTNLPWYVRLVWRLFHMAKWPQRLLLNRADYVSTVSHTSKRYIEDMHLTDREVGVVYNAASTTITELLDAAAAETQATAAAGGAAAEQKRILYMGSFMPYKNTETLIRAMGELPSNYSLHLLSKIAPDRLAELQAIVPAGATVVFENGVTEAEYASMLVSAHCLATASQVEGFGLPIVEAQTTGTPVVCTDMDIFHEVAGEGALFCGATDVSAFAAAIASLDEPEIRAGLIERATRHASQFEWTNSAREVERMAVALTAGRGRREAGRAESV